MLDASPTDAPSAPGEHSPLEKLRHAIEHAAHYLPAQGPITVFIHHNTLHAFEDYPFDEGVQRGAKVFGCQPYLTEDRYREKLHRGRIRQQDIEAVLLDDLGEAADVLIGFMGTRFHFRRGMLQYPLQIAPSAELRWFVGETDALTRFRRDAPPEVRQRFIDETQHWVLRDHRHGADLRAGHEHTWHERHLREVLAGLIEQFGRSSIDQWSEATWETFTLTALWRICRDGVHSVKLPAPAHAPGIRHRDALYDVLGSDIDLLVNSLLIRFCAAFLDQGFSRWPLPERQRGFFAAFCALYRAPGGPPDAWLSGLAAEITRLEQAGHSPLEIVREALQLLGVAEEKWDAFITKTLLALRGWAGMIQQMEIRGDRVAHPVPPGSLIELLAVRLVLERLALAHLLKEELGAGDPLDGLRHAIRRYAAAHESAGVDQRAFQVFQLAQVLGWLPPALAQLSKQEWTTLIAEIEAFPAVERRRVLHAAFERRYRVQALDTIALHSRQPTGRVTSPRFHVICCLDEREESFRRHVEEIEPECETFGAAGFYSIPMYFRGAADAHFVPLCPIVIRPQHWVVEDVVYTLDEVHGRLTRARRVLGIAGHQLHVGSRTFTGGALLTAGLGALASIPLVARVLFPRLTAAIRQTVGRFVQPPEHTRLELERTTDTAGPEDGHHGFTLHEMTNMGERLLLDIGLTSNFAPLVLILGHGSNSLNNPHNSAYNCGACGGGCGGPNARALAQILNDPRVRDRLTERGLAVPDRTWFVGGWHNTCNDSVSYFDLELLPKSHHHEFTEIRQIIEQTCDRNAHERCRRFMSAPLSMTPAQARRHVEARAEDLAQTRPECGHATNALCIVARRSRTRGLYLDRRAFLTTYDPTQDDAENSILTRLLQAAVPVCGGINLEYYFSYVDNPGYGCGTKLPHNVTSLLGVMDGAASDLRTGLPWQMVEIHEPLRLLFVIETTPEAMNRIMDRNPGIGKLCRNGWVQVATLSPDSSQIHLLTGGRFEPYSPEATELPHVPSSIDWYRGWREHLGFAVIEQ